MLLLFLALILWLNTTRIFQKFPPIIFPVFLTSYFMFRSLSIWNLLWHIEWSRERWNVSCPINPKISTVPSLISNSMHILDSFPGFSFFQFKEIWVCSMTLECNKPHLYKHPRQGPRQQGLWLDLSLWQSAPFDPFAKKCRHMDLPVSCYHGLWVVYSWLQVLPQKPLFLLSGIKYFESSLPAIPQSSTHPQSCG